MDAEGFEPTHKKNWVTASRASPTAPRILVLFHNEKPCGAVRLFWGRFLFLTLEGLENPDEIFCLTAPFSLTLLGIICLPRLIIITGRHSVANGGKALFERRFGRFNMSNDVFHSKLSVAHTFQLVKLFLKELQMGARCEPP